MANARWDLVSPALPVTFDADTYKESPPAVTVRTEMDAAVSPKTRRRSATSHRIISGNMTLTIPQAQAFDDFYVTDCVAGTKKFQGLLHPRTNDDSVWLFSAEPEYVNEGPLIFAVSLKLVLLPETPE